MSEIILSSSLPVPLPKEELNIRPATPEDMKFIDDLQKQHSKQIGFMYESWLVGKIKANQVLIAETAGERIGYIIAQDRYLKRDELGIVYQLVVKPGKQRGFIGAALLKAQFDRSAPGCRLYCCWCAQDLQANHFWESMGFYPLAFRNGADGKGKNGKPRVHIFWEKKIRGNEDTYPWWFPSKTDAGAMQADRLALPIKPEVHWSEVEPIEIPVIESTEPKLIEEKKSATSSRAVKKIAPIPPVMNMISSGRMGAPKAIIKETKPEKPKREKKPKAKIDPAFLAASRDLRDKYLELVNERGFKLESAGKYELTRDNKSAHPYTLSQARGSGKLLEAA